MSRIAAVGERRLIEGLQLAGVDLIPAETSAAVRTAWEALPPDTLLVLVTPAAATALAVDPPAVQRLRYILPFNQPVAAATHG